MNEDKNFENVQMLKEMVESMTDSIESLNKVVSQQIDLIKVIKASDKKDEFEDFVKGIDEQITEQKCSAGRLIARRDLLEQICNEADDDKEKAALIEDLLIGLAVFHQ